MGRWGTWLLALSGLVPVIGVLTGSPPNAILMHTLFVIAYFFRSRLTLHTPPKRLFLRFVVWTLICGWLVETLAWINAYILRELEPVLFHPQLFADLLIATGLYLAWAVAWWWGLRRFAFALPAVYTVVGMYGVLIENSGAVFQAGLAALPLGIIFWLYVFVVYGATMALALLPFRELFKSENTRWYRYPVMFAAMFLCTYVIFYAYNLILQTLNLIPLKRPIWEAPLW